MEEEVDYSSDHELVAGVEAEEVKVCIRHMAVGN